MSIPAASRAATERAESLAICRVLPRDLPEDAREAPRAPLGFIGETRLVRQRWGRAWGAPDLSSRPEVAMPNRFLLPTEMIELGRAVFQTDDVVLPDRGVGMVFTSTKRHVPAEYPRLSVRIRR